MKKAFTWIVIIGVGLLIISALTGDEEKSPNEGSKKPAKEEKTVEGTSPSSSGQTQKDTPVTKTEEKEKGLIASFHANPSYKDNPFEITSIMIVNASKSKEPDGKIRNYEWNFGDGTSINNGHVTESHTYSEKGEYTITLTVTNDDGETDTATRTVTVPQGKSVHFSDNKGAKTPSEEESGSKNSSERYSGDVPPLEMMATVFEGNYTKSQIERSVHEAMRKYDLPLNETYEEKVGSTLVALTDEYGVKEMEILQCVNTADLKSVNNATKFYQAAAFCVTYLKSS